MYVDASMSSALAIFFALASARVAGTLVLSMPYRKTGRNITSGASPSTGVPTAAGWHGEQLEWVGLWSVGSKAAGAQSTCHRFSLWTSRTVVV